MAQFARRFVGERGSAGDRMLIERELDRLRYPADAQAAPQKQVEPANPQEIPIPLHDQDMDIELPPPQDEIGHQSTSSLLTIKLLKSPDLPRQKFLRTHQSICRHHQGKCNAWTQFLIVKQEKSKRLLAFAWTIPLSAIYATMTRMKVRLSIAVFALKPFMNRVFAKVT